MFRQRMNELRLTLQLSPRGPLLVKAGENLDRLADREDVGRLAGGFDQLYDQALDDINQRAKPEKEERENKKKARMQETGDKHALQDKVDLDMRFVTIRRNGHDEPYLPGSGLKGVLRTRAEQFARTFLPANERVCDIFDEDHPDLALRSCTKTVPEEDGRVTPPAERYARACRICQLFGCGGLAGRLSVSDAFLLAQPAPACNTRSGVGIDRRRGAASEGALFFYEVLERGAFEVTLTLENFELWQVGLVAHLVHEVITGALPVGYGTRRGLGRLQGHVQTAVLTYFGTAPHAVEGGCTLHGVATLSGDAAVATYKLLPEKSSTLILPGAVLHSQGLRQSWTLPAGALEATWQAGAKAWQRLTATTEEVAR
jgi:CRISPR/Cas system CSM-associated protein Csm3 (group 7 of RAMP superfamily)